MTSLLSIQEFLTQKNIAIAGVSREKKNFGYQVFKQLKDKGYHVYPLNPYTETIDGEKCFSSVSSLPPEIQSLLVLTPPKETDKIVKEAIDKGIKHIWIQQMSETKEIIDFALNQPVNLIYKKCIFMFAEPVKGFHKFHRSLVKFFGKFPK